MWPSHSHSFHIFLRCDVGTVPIIVHPPGCAAPKFSGPFSVGRATSTPRWPSQCYSVGPYNRAVSLLLALNLAVPKAVLLRHHSVLSRSNVICKFTIEPSKSTGLCSVKWRDWVQSLSHHNGRLGRLEFGIVHL